MMPEKRLTHLSLFSGIPVGGIDLAAEWAGFETVAFVERDPFCQRVLRKHWPEVPIYDDVTTFDATQFRGVHLVSGGFPCQDVSNCSRDKAGVLDGVRSSLWFEMLRVVRECRPVFVLAENVAALRVRGSDRVMYGLEQAGYTVEAFVVGAGNAGAPHLRKRVFIVGADTQSERWGRWRRVENPRQRQAQSKGLGATNVWRTIPVPAVRGVANGAPRRLDGHRLRALGNAVVPQQVYPILKAIAEAI